MIIGLKLESQRELLGIIFQENLINRETSLNRIKNYVLIGLEETSQELRMLSSVTLNCQVTMIVMKSGSQLSEMPTILHNFSSHVFAFVFVRFNIYVSTSLKGCQDPPLKLFSKCLCLCLSFFGQVMSPYMDISLGRFLFRKFDFFNFYLV